MKEREKKGQMKKKISIEIIDLIKNIFLSFKNLEK